MTKERREEIETGPNDRREFMATAGKLAAVLSVLGLTGEAAAAGRESSSAKMVLDQAMKTGDMNKALKQHGSKLDKRQMQALESLSKADLQQLNNLQRKLAPAGIGDAAHGYGVF